MVWSSSLAETCMLTLAGPSGSVRSKATSVCAGAATACTRTAVLLRRRRTACCRPARMQGMGFGWVPARGRLCRRALQRAWNRGSYRAAARERRQPSGGRAQLHCEPGRPGSSLRLATHLW
jgi:hypothetical protein